MKRSAWVLPVALVVGLIKVTASAGGTFTVANSRNNFGKTYNAR